MCSFIMLSIMSGPILAEKIPEARVKVGFIYNFIKLIKPVKPLNNHYTLCVIGRSSMRQYLPELNKQQVHGVTIDSIDISSGNSPILCDCLVIGEMDQPAILGSLLTYAENNGILTITDVSKNIHYNVIFYLKNLQGKLRFDVNLALARKASFKLDANLLRLAHIVKQ